MKSRFANAFSTIPIRFVADLLQRVFGAAWDYIQAAADEPVLLLCNQQLNEEVAER